MNLKSISGEREREREREREASKLLYGVIRYGFVLFEILLGFYLLPKDAKSLKSTWVTHYQKMLISLHQFHVYHFQFYQMALSGVKAEAHTVTFHINLCKMNTTKVGHVKCQRLVEKNEKIWQIHFHLVSQHPLVGYKKN